MIGYHELTATEVKRIVEEAIAREGKRLGKRNGHGGAAAFAEKCGVSRTAISLFRRTGRPSEKVCAVLGIKVTRAKIISEVYWAKDGRGVS